LLDFGPINDLSLLVTGQRQCRSLAKVTKQVKIEQSKLFFVILKTISVIPYSYNFLVSYPLSLKLFCQYSYPLSLKPLTKPHSTFDHFAFDVVFLKFKLLGGSDVMLCAQAFNMASKMADVQIVLVRRGYYNHAKR